MGGSFVISDYFIFYVTYFVYITTSYATQSQQLVH